MLRNHTGRSSRSSARRLKAPISRSQSTSRSTTITSPALRSASTYERRSSNGPVVVVVGRAATAWALIRSDEQLARAHDRVAAHDLDGRPHQEEVDPEVALEVAARLPVDAEVEAETAVAEGPVRRHARVRGRSEQRVGAEHDLA